MTNERPEPEESLRLLAVAAWRTIDQRLRAMGTRGILLLQLLTTVLAFAAGAYVVNPVEEGVDHVGEPAVQVLGLIDNKCPSGWKADARRDEHTRVSYCDRGNWRVYLHEDGKVSHGCPLVAGVCAGRFVFPDFANNKFDVPEWPQ